MKRYTDSMIKKSYRTYKIGQMARMFGIHEDTLRNWDNEGLVVAERVGTRRDRRYTEKHIMKILESGLVERIDRDKERKDYKEIKEFTNEDIVAEMRMIESRMNKRITKIHGLLTVILSFVKVIDDDIIKKYNSRSIFLKIVDKVFGFKT